MQTFYSTDFIKFLNDCDFSFVFSVLSVIILEKMQHMRIDNKRKNHKRLNKFGIILLRICI